MKAARDCRTAPERYHDARPRKKMKATNKQDAVKLWTELGVSHFRERDFDEAEMCFSQALHQIDDDYQPSQQVQAVLSSIGNGHQNASLSGEITSQSSSFVNERPTTSSSKTKEDVIASHNANDLIKRRFVKDTNMTKACTFIASLSQSKILKTCRQQSRLFGTTSPKSTYVEINMEQRLFGLSTVFPKEEKRWSARLVRNLQQWCTTTLATVSIVWGE